MNASIQRILHWVGGALAIIGVIYVGVRFNSYASQVDYSHFETFTFVILIVLSLVYVIVNFLLAEAWMCIIRYFGVNRTRIWGIRIYGFTQLAKYVPGNIMHLASRQAVGLGEGVSGLALAKAAVWELGLLSIAAASFCFLLLPLFVSSITIQVSIAGFVFLIVLLTILFNKIIDLKIAVAFWWYIIFLFISGVIFQIVLMQVVADGPIPLGQNYLFFSAFIIAWLIGLITPGAPAGIGVRELVLVFLLKSIVSEADLLLAVLLTRIVTVLGDIGFFVVSAYFHYNESSA